METNEPEEVEGEVVDEGTYPYPARCGNCGWSGNVQIPKGMRATVARLPCPRCGVTGAMSSA
jgi:transcription elongation factor Elf1